MSTLADRLMAAGFSTLEANLIADAIANPITGVVVASGKTVTFDNTLTFSGTDGTSFVLPSTGGTFGTAAFATTGTTGHTVPFLDGANTWTATNVVAGSFHVGNGTAAVNEFLNGAASQVKTLRYRTVGVDRWQVLTDASAETGNSAGSQFLIASYLDSGAFGGTLLNGQRRSGSLGTGGPWISNLAPAVTLTPKATNPGGVVGNEVNFLATGDVQPTTTLANNPLTVTNGSPTVTISWPGCAETTGPLYIGVSEVWVNLSGATAVGGITPTGWLKVQSNPTVNSATVTWTSSATSGATGGGAAVTVTPSFRTQAEKFFHTITTGAHGFSVGRSEYVVANPSFYQLQAGGSGPQFQGRFGQFYGPNDTSQLNYWGAIWNEQNFINRGADEGYSPNLTGAPRPTIGTFYGPETTVEAFIPGGGTVQNWNTMHAIFGRTGLVGIYGGFSIQPNALVGAARDPNSHGGVGHEIFGSYTRLANSVPFTTAIGTSTITVTVLSIGTTGDLSVQANGDTLYIPATYTISGVTFGAGTYTMAAVNKAAGTFTITGSGAAAATVSGGGSDQIVFFANLVPYAPAQIWGSWKHGISVNTNSRFEDGLVVASIPGAGIGWNDGTGTATVTGTEVSAGNVSVTITPAGTGRITLAGTTTIPTSTPASASAPGVAGTVTWDTSFFYVCTATNTWKRVAIATW